MKQPKTLTKSELKQLATIKECIRGQMSLAKLAKQLKVSHPGLASRVIRLLRREYEVENYLE